MSDLALYLTEKENNGTLVTLITKTCMRTKNEHVNDNDFLAKPMRVRSEVMTVEVTNLVIYASSLLMIIKKKQNKKQK